MCITTYILFLIIIILVIRYFYIYNERFGSTDWVDQWRSLYAPDNLRVQRYVDENGLIREILVRIPNNNFVPMMNSY